MNVNVCLRLCGIALLLVSASVSSCFAADDRPNILLIVADDLGYSDVGYQGVLPTPSIDRLARQGVIARQAYVSASVCSPSRAGLITGKYQERFGYYDNPPVTTNPDIGLPLSETTMADDLKAAGYWTAAIGKWHLGLNDIYHPLNRGFNSWYGFRGGQHSYYTGAVERDRQAVGFTGYLTDVFANEAIAQMRSHTEAPWFVYLAFNAPHVPLQVPPAPAACPGTSGDRRVFCQMVARMDQNIGRVVAAADAGTRPTVVVFLSDNGGPLHNGATNAPLRNGKGSAYEGGLRVPFVFRYPGVQGSYARPVISLDLRPTFAAIAQTQAPGDGDGINILPFLQGRAGQPHRRLFWHKKSAFAALDTAANLKLVIPGGTVASGAYALSSDIGERNRLPMPRYLLDDLDAWDGGNAVPRW